MGDPQTHANTWSMCGHIRTTIAFSHSTDSTCVADIPALGA